MKLLRLLALALVVAAAGAAVALAAKSPKAELAAIRRAANHKSAVHYVAVSTSQGSKVTLVCDVAHGRGVQLISIKSHGKKGHGAVRVYKSIAYLKGDAFTMHVFFGFDGRQSKKYANDWIYVPHTSTAYNGIAAGATYGTFLPTLIPAPTLSLVKSGKLIGVRGSGSNSGLTEVLTLFAPAKGVPLPAKLVASFPGHQGGNAVTMSSWNEKVRVAVPKHAIPIEALTGG